MTGNEFGEDENKDELAMVLFVKAIAAVLPDDIGVVIHHNDQGYLVYKSSEDSTISIQDSPRFLELEHGLMVSAVQCDSVEDLEILLNGQESDSDGDGEVRAGDPTRLAKN